MCTRIGFHIPIRFLLLIFFIAACAPGSPPPNRADLSTPSTPESEARLIQVYNDVLDLYREDPVFTNKLEAAQRQWQKYRDAHLEARFPAPEKRSAYGSVYPSCYGNEMERLARLRTEELMRWMEGHPEGELCGGSIRMR